MNPASFNEGPLRNLNFGGLEKLISIEDHEQNGQIPSEHTDGHRPADCGWDHNVWNQNADGGVQKSRSQESQSESESQYIDALYNPLHH